MHPDGSPGSAVADEVHIFEQVAILESSCLLENLSPAEYALVSVRKSEYPSPEVGPGGDPVKGGCGRLKSQREATQAYGRIIENASYGVAEIMGRNAVVVKEEKQISRRQVGTVVQLDAPSPGSDDSANSIPDGFLFPVLTVFPLNHNDFVVRPEFARDPVQEGTESAHRVQSGHDNGESVRQETGVGQEEQITGPIDVGSCPESSERDARLLKKPFGSRSHIGGSPFRMLEDWRAVVFQTDEVKTAVRRGADRGISIGQGLEGFQQVGRFDVRDIASNKHPVRISQLRCVSKGGLHPFAQVFALLVNDFPWSAEFRNDLSSAAFRSAEQENAAVGV